MPRKSNKQELTCVACNKIYYKSPSKAKGSKYCSRMCMNTTQALANKKERIEVKCEYCNDIFEKPHDSKQRFCSFDCSQSFAKPEIVSIVCEYCSTTFEKPESRVTKFCGKSCQHKAQSSGLIEIPSSGRMGFRKDLPSNYFFKSSLEADYARYCEAINKPYIYEHKTFEVNIGGSTKVYTPDFYHPDENKYVETKAIRRDQKYSGNISAAEELINQGVNLEIMLMSDFYKMLRRKGLYYGIDNLENKNYLGTKSLIYLKAKQPKQ